MDKCFSRRSTPECYVVLFACGKVGEVECFMWDRQSGITLAVFREVQPDLQKPFFFSEAGHHILRMKRNGTNKFEHNLEIVMKAVESTIRTDFFKLRFLF